MTSTLARGDTFVGNPDERLAFRHMITVKRVAKDDSWADIDVQTWAVGWSKRQPLKDGEFAFPHETFGAGAADWFVAQRADHMAWLAEGDGATNESEGD